MTTLAKIWFLLMGTFSLIVVSAYAQASLPVSIEQIDQLAGKSDRWLFLALLIVLLIFVGLVIKWLMTQLDNQRAAGIASTKELIDHLKTNAVEFKTALQANTDALSISNVTNQEISQLLKDDHRVLALLQDEKERTKL